MTANINHEISEERAVAEQELSLTAIAQRFGCTEAQVLAQYAKNGEQLRSMAAAAHRRIGGKLNGYTAQELDGQADRYLPKPSERQIKRLTMQLMVQGLSAEQAREEALLRLQDKRARRST